MALPRHGSGAPHNLLQRLASEVAGEGIFFLDESGIITSWPAAAEAITGWPAGEAIGQHVSVLYVPEDADSGQAARDLTEARTRGHWRGQRTWLRRPDVRYCADLVLCYLPNSAAGDRFGLLVRDVTERSQQHGTGEAILRMETLGQMAAAVAHDVNNLMMVIARSCEQLQQAPALGADQHADLDRITVATGQAISLARQLLALTRRSDLPPDVLDLGAALAHAGALLQRTMGKRIEVALHAPGHTLWVRAHEGDVGQILVNLAVNARDAMPDGGVFSVQASAVALDAAEARARGLSAGAYARLVVSDTGTGMTPEVRARAFDRFFTTKPTGTGIGLATVHRVVQQRGGHVEIDSAPGQGTQFVILLPLTDPPVSRDVLVTDRDLHARSGETVLVVEDEPAVREIVASILRTLRYCVIEAGSGAEAVAAATRNERVDLIVTDLALPDASGVELARWLTARLPDTRVLLISGNADDRAGSELAGAAGGFVWLQKPFSSRALGQKVRDLLDEANRP